MLFNLKVLFYVEFLLMAGLLAYRWALLPRFRGLIGGRTVALAALTPAVAFLGGNIYLFYAYLFCAVAFTSRSRIELLGTYLLMLPMMPSLQLDVEAGGVFLLTVTSFLFLNAGAVVGMVLTRGRVRRTDPVLDLAAFALFAMFVYINARGVSSTTVARVVAQQALTILPPYLLASRAVRDADDARRALAMLTAAATMGCAVALFGLLRHWPLYENMYAALGLELPSSSSYVAVRGGRMRMGGPLNDYTAFGLFLAFLLAMLPGVRGLFRHAGFPAVAGLLLLGLFATQSRGAWVALMIGWPVSLWLRGKGAAAGAGLAAAGLGFAALPLLAPGSRLAETLGTSGASADTGTYRQRLLSRGLDMVAEHPLAGQPPTSLVARLQDLVQGQQIVDFVNTHLWVAMAAGVPAFAIWAAIWLSTVGRLGARRRRGEGWVRRSGILSAPAAGIAVVTVALAFTSLIDRNLVWPMLLLGMATPALTARRARTVRAPAPEAAREPAPAGGLVA